MTYEEVAIRKEILKDIKSLVFEEVVFFKMAAKGNRQVYGQMVSMMATLIERKGIYPLTTQELIDMDDYLLRVIMCPGAPEDTPSSRQSWLDTSVRRESLYPGIHVEKGSPYPEPVNLFGLEIWAEGKYKGMKAKVMVNIAKYLYIPGTYRNIREGIQEGDGIMHESRFKSRNKKLFNIYYMHESFGDWDYHRELKFEVLLRVLSPVF